MRGSTSGGASSKTLAEQGLLGPRRLYAGRSKLPVVDWTPARVRHLERNVLSEGERHTHIYSHLPSPLQPPPPPRLPAPLTGEREVLELDREEGGGALVLTNHALYTVETASASAVARRGWILSGSKLPNGPPKEYGGWQTWKSVSRVSPPGEKAEEAEKVEVEKRVTDSPCALRPAPCAPTLHPHPRPHLHHSPP